MNCVFLTQFCASGPGLSPGPGPRARPGPRAPGRGPLTPGPLRLTPDSETRIRKLAPGFGNSPESSETRESGIRKPRFTQNYKPGFEHQDSDTRVRKPGFGNQGSETVGGTLETLRGEGSCGPPERPRRPWRPLERPAGLPGLPGGHQQSRGTPGALGGVVGRLP